MNLRLLKPDDRWIRLPDGRWARVLPLPSPAEALEDYNREKQAQSDARD